ncbi:hypothetical protein [Bacteroides rodentium]|uniref:hypothetical protein n=1 Tax=Bacteroides rodentium TaxID=691816 RepID=UPI0010084EBF|nr:hypothetical protein [Bacteroides rodentium]
MAALVCPQVFYVHVAGAAAAVAGGHPALHLHKHHLHKGRRVDRCWHILRVPRARRRDKAQRSRSVILTTEPEIIFTKRKEYRPGKPLKRTFTGNRKKGMRKRVY